MLILTRRNDEAVLIRVNGVEIKVVVVSARGGRVLLGFDAPRDTATINREEVQRKIDQEAA